ncbi:MAG: hypothetical protein IID34_08530, partial [Planctomycetes bacterium]|nr:hypothetical protein [Planctomycetota bacterium]
VRLRYAYWIKCTDVSKNDAGEVIELRCTYDPQTRGGNNPPDGRKVKGTIHWVSAAHALTAEVRLYDHLFATPNPDDVSETRPSGSAPSEPRAPATGQANADCGLRNSESPAQHSALSTQHSTGTFLDNLNPNSLEVLTDCKLEPSLAAAPSPEGVPPAAGPPVQYQFERNGYFYADADSTPDKLIFNRTVTLRDTWAKIAKKK